MHRTQNLTAPAADTDGLEPVTPADILRGAARYLEIHGWTQSHYYGGEPADAFPPACAIGAIGMAAHGTLTFCPQMEGPNPRECNLAVTYLTGYLTGEGQIRVPTDDTLDGEWDCEPTSAGEWNDQTPTVDKVTTFLRAAADEYDWQHAAPDDLETYAENELDYDRVPTREGFLAWLGACR